MLSIASHLYALGARVRRRAVLSRADGQRRLDRPVISVGNLTVGGAGKTPVVAFLARMLLEAGERPSILSRGYARTRSEDGVTIVSDGVRLRADLDRAGDEPLMLARTLPRVPVLVSADRYLAGRLAELRLGASLHLLDDGFQHFGLARAVNLLVIDPGDLERPWLVPKGRLREPLSAAKYADAVLVTSPGADLASIANRLGVDHAFAVIRELGSAMEETLSGPQPIAAGSRVVVVSGIARPERFEEETRAAGYDVADVMRFRDHHPYTVHDFATITATLEKSGARIVLTTEKDLMRLLPLRPWPFRVAMRPLRVRIEPDGFGAWILSRVRGAEMAG